MPLSGGGMRESIARGHGAAEGTSTLKELENHTAEDAERTESCTRGSLCELSGLCGDRCVLSASSYSEAVSVSAWLSTRHQETARSRRATMPDVR
jgi:hypothetical protein